MKVRFTQKLYIEERKCDVIVREKSFIKCSYKYRRFSFDFSLFCGFYIVWGCGSSISLGKWIGFCVKLCFIFVLHRKKHLVALFGDWWRQWGKCFPFFWKRRYFWMGWNRESVISRGIKWNVSFLHFFTPSLLHIIDKVVIFIRFLLCLFLQHELRQRKTNFFFHGTLLLFSNVLFHLLQKLRVLWCS